MILINILLILLVFIVGALLVIYYINKNKNAEVEKEVDQDDQTYTLDKMREYVKKRLDEITKVNLYDIGLSEEELKEEKTKNMH